jgi:thymidine kinase
MEHPLAKLYFYYSTMNAGKSTILLQSNYNYQERGMRTVLFTPAVDNRYAEGTIHSRIGLSAKASSFTADTSLGQQLKAILTENPSPVHCVLIDEAQFLTKPQVHELTEITDHLNIPVLAYGLRTDFRGEPFPGSQYLLALADEIVEIKTVCHCGRKATMNIRLGQDGAPVREGAQIEIGGNEKYVATCRKHFKLGLTTSTSESPHEHKQSRSVCES